MFARDGGVRANFQQTDKPGQLAKILEEIAEAKGNIISVITRESKDEGKRRLTIKVTGITLEKMKEILVKMDSEIIDIRMV